MLQGCTLGTSDCCSIPVAARKKASSIVLNQRMAAFGKTRRLTTHVTSNYSGVVVFAITCKVGASKRES